MTNPEHAAEPQSLTAEYITAQTGFILRGSYEPDVFNHPWGRQALKEHVRSLQHTHGHDNVMTSFYENPDRKPRIGIFAKPTHTPRHARSEQEWAGGLATRETMEMPPVDPDDTSMS